MGLSTVRIQGPNATANGGALVQKLQATTKAGKLFAFTLYNTSGSSQYLQFFDSASTPSNGTVPLFQINMPSDSHANFTSPVGKEFKNGIFVGNSSTSASYTPGSADCLIDVDFWNY